MKNIFSLALLTIALISSIVGCKTNTKAMTPSKGEAVVPCLGPDFFTNTKFFRANSVGASEDQLTSKKEALVHARAELESNIQATIKAATDSYVNSTQMNNKKLVEERFEQINREVIEEKLTSFRTICEKLIKTESENYKTYIAIELSADEIVATYNEKLSKDDLLKVDYDYEKFKETFEKEMEKLGNN